MLKLATAASLAVLANGASWDNYTAALQLLNWTAVDEEIEAALSTPNPIWLPDYGYYGPLIIRLAWHCAGSYRESDGRGGCDGGRIRWDPEASWDDNANLDKARAILEPVKTAFGEGLSYGDLYIRAGYVAIKNMGGPVLGFCAGRVDDPDGSASLDFLGPSPAQQANFPCLVAGDCKPESGLGPTTIGLIYVNPEGPLGNGNATASAPQIRDTFARMGMDDIETVALIGGGHAFGKVHGGCNHSTGVAPNWVGSCNDHGGTVGQGQNAFTSGFEGPWTTTPTQWSNSYFTNLKNGNWTQFVGSGGHKQFHIETGSPLAPQVNDSTPSVPINMLVADIALTKDAAFNAAVNFFAANASALDRYFQDAWYKLTTRDMGPRKRCFGGTQVPPLQPFQDDLPTPTTFPNYTAVKADIRAVLYTSSPAAGITADASGGHRFGGQFAQLAWQCASTYRATDYRGGCNGARIRFKPESEFKANVDLKSDVLISMLSSIKSKHTQLSWADLIVLAGHTAVEDMFGFGMPFCGGRADALDGNHSKNLNPPNWTDPLVNFKERAARMGLTQLESVLLTAVPNKASTVFGIDHFEEIIMGNGTVTGSALVIRNDPALKALVMDISNATFQADFTAAWNKVMNADFFMGWNGLSCPSPVAATTPPAIPAGGTPTSYSAANNCQLGLATIVLLALLC